MLVIGNLIRVENLDLKGLGSVGIIDVDDVLNDLKGAISASQQAEIDECGDTPLDGRRTGCSRHVSQGTNSRCATVAAQPFLDGGQHRVLLGRRSTGSGERDGRRDGGRVRGVGSGRIGGHASHGIGRVRQFPVSSVRWLFRSMGAALI